MKLVQFQWCYNHVSLPESWTSFISKIPLDGHPVVLSTPPAYQLHVPVSVSIHGVFPCLMENSYWLSLVSTDSSSVVICEHLSIEHWEIRFTCHLSLEGHYLNFATQRVVYSVIAPTWTARPVLIRPVASMSIPLRHHFSLCHLTHLVLECSCAVWTQPPGFKLVWVL